VQVAFVENINDILNVPNETLFILDQSTDSGNNPPDLRADLSADEDINKIEQFLGQPLVTASSSGSSSGDNAEVQTVVKLMVPVESAKPNHQLEEQPSEDIDEIQKFLERSQVDQQPSATVGDIQEEPPAPLRYKIPKSPEFKKRFLNKEIVKIVKGTDSHKSQEKVQQVKKARPAAPSFEEQLHEAELIDMRTTMEKKRKWKNKSSTRDYMITKKYAKIVGLGKKPESATGESGDQSAASTEKRLVFTGKNVILPVR
jgi:hypothetical protein